MPWATRPPMGCTNLPLPQKRCRRPKSSNPQLPPSSKALAGFPTVRDLGCTGKPRLILIWGSTEKPQLPPSLQSPSETIAKGP